MTGKLAVRGLVALIALFLLIQVLPLGRNHTNPAVVAEPAWDSAQTRDLAVRACFDCHSNETVWPWYSNIAPASWLVQRHIEEGRSKLNFSEWGVARPQRGGEEEEGEGAENEGAEEAVEVIRKGEMPPGYYRLAHASARLTAAEIEALVSGLTATLGAGGD